MARTLLTIRKFTGIITACALITVIGKVYGLDFTEAKRLFNPSLFVDIDDREDYGEERYVGLGLLDGRVVVVILAAALRIYAEAQKYAGARSA